MPSKRLLVLLLTATILELSNAQCHIVPTDLNTKWRGADVIERYIHDVYQSIALGSEDVDDAQKRFTSIISRALILHFNSDKTNEIESIKDAARKVKKQLDKPADVLGGTYRAWISLLMSFVEQPITDEQEACPNNVHEHECNVALAKLHEKRIKQCPDYKKNLDFYKIFKEWINGCGVQNWLEDLTIASECGTDDGAIDFFIETTSVKYPSTFQTLKDLYKTVTRETCTCNAFSFL